MKSIIALFAVLGFVSVANANDQAAAPAADAHAAPAAEAAHAEKAAKPAKKAKKTKKAAKKAISISLSSFFHFLAKTHHYKFTLFNASRV